MPCRIWALSTFVSPLPPTSSLLPLFQLHWLYYLLLNSKSPQNLEAKNNKHYLTVSVGQESKHTLGDACGSRSLTSCSQDIGHAGSLIWRLNWGRTHLQVHSCRPLLLTGSSLLAIGQRPPFVLGFTDHSTGQLMAACFIRARVLGVPKTTPKFRVELEALCSHHIVVLTLSTVEKKHSQIIREKDTGRAWRNPLAGSLMLSPSHEETHRSYSSSSNKNAVMCVWCFCLGKPSKDSVPKDFIRGCSHRQPLLSVH